MRRLFQTVEHVVHHGGEFVDVFRVDGVMNVEFSRVKMS